MNDVIWVLGSTYYFKDLKIMGIEDCCKIRNYVSKIKQINGHA